jgi:hypothetical protein
MARDNATKVLLQKLTYAMQMLAILEFEKGTCLKVHNFDYCLLIVMYKC